MKKKNPATIQARIQAYVIDLLIELSLSMIFTLSAYSILSLKQDEMMGYFQIICLILSFLWLFVYIPYKNNGQTIGKHIKKIQVVDEKSHIPPLSKCVVREYLMKFLLCPIFFIMCLIWIVFAYVKNKQIPIEMPQDILLKTVVIRNETSSNFRIW